MATGRRQPGQSRRLWEKLRSFRKPCEQSRKHRASRGAPAHGSGSASASGSDSDSGWLWTSAALCRDPHAACWILKDRHAREVLTMGDRSPVLVGGNPAAQ